MNSAPNVPVDTSPAARRPLVLVPACNKMLGDHPYHIAGKKYADAVRLAGCLPLVIPNADEIELQALLAIADGVFLTGSPSNVHPSHFDEDVLDLSLPLDPARDAWTLPLIRHALAVGLPLFTVCRGTQETNVALGGSLHQAVHDVAGKARPSRRPRRQPIDDAIRPGARGVRRARRRARTCGRAGRRFDVNSVHGQAVQSTGRRPARGSARARRRGRGVLPRADAAKGSTCACSGTPNGKLRPTRSRCSMLTAFGQACRQYRSDREGLRGPHP